MKIAEGFVLLFDQGVNKKVNKHFNIRHQFQNLTPCLHDMIHTVVSWILDVYDNSRENVGS